MGYMGELDQLQTFIEWPEYRDSADYHDAHVHGVLVAPKFKQRAVEVAAGASDVWLFCLELNQHADPCAVPPLPDRFRGDARELRHQAYGAIWQIMNREDDTITGVPVLSEGVSVKREGGVDDA